MRKGFIKEVMDRFFKGECDSTRICILSCFGDLMLKDTGASVRIFHLAKGLAGLGHEIHIVIPGSNKTCKWVDGVVIHRMSGLCPNRVLVFFSHLLGALRFTSLMFYDLLFILRTCRLIIKSDIIQIEQPWACGLIIPLIKVFKKLLVVDSHDTFQALRINHTSILRKILETFLEKIAYKCADMILTVSKNDEEFLISYGTQRGKILIVPNGVDAEVFAASLGTTYIVNQFNLKDFFKVVFVGNLEYSPNQEAVRAIASILAPKIQSRINNVKFLIVGRAPRKIESPSLIFTGVVENVREFLAVSDVAIAPLFHGSGTRLKILEYLASSLPVVSTTVGVEGLEVENGVNILIEDDMNEFAIKVTKLLTDRVLSTRLGKVGRELVRSKYDWLEIVSKLNGVYHKLLSSRISTYEDAYMHFSHSPAAQQLAKGDGILTLTSIKQH